MKSLTIITVCKNEEATIGRTIQSVASQTYPNIEYIVIDGGSTDGTLSIIERYRGDISQIISGEDTGIFDAQNKGIELASGEYIAFLNGGDRLCNDNIYEKVFLQEPQSDIIYGDVIIELTSGTLFRKKSPPVVDEMFMMFDSIPHPGTVFRRELFDRLGRYDLSYKSIADYEFFLKSIFKNKVSYEYRNFPFAVFNIKGVSSTREKTPETVQLRKKAQQENLNPSTIENFEKNKTFYLLFNKKIRYIYYLLLSKISGKFLKLKS